MERYSKEIDEFLKTMVLPKLGFDDYNEDNIDDIFEYLFAIEAIMQYLKIEGKSFVKKINTFLKWLQKQ